MNDKVAYTLAGPGCHNVANAVWSIDLNTPDYPVSNYQGAENEPGRPQRAGNGKTAQHMSSPATGRPLSMPTAWWR